MKKNGVFVTIQDIYDEQTMRSNSGVIKKILSQYGIFEKYFNMRMDIFKRDLKTGFIYKILIRTPFYPVHCHWRLTNDYSNIDFMYIRMETIDRFFIRFLKQVRKQNPHIVIISEIATYPYDKEFRTIRNLHVLIKNRYNRKKLYKYVSRIITYSQDDIIFGIKTIKIINGIETTSVPVVSSAKDNTTINLISVANMAFWHGLDRLISGMADYYKNDGNRDIRLDIVGYGEEYDKVIDLIEKNNLKQHIFMHGFLNGEKLDAVYDNADIAVSSLGDHRKGLSMISALKTREYLARGLPMVASSIIDVLPKKYKYCLYIPQDETPVNIKDIIAFHDTIYSQITKKEIIREIRNFAIEFCDMKNTFKPVLDYINNTI